MVFFIDFQAQLIISDWTAASVCAEEWIAVAHRMVLFRLRLYPFPVIILIDE